MSYSVFIPRCTHLKTNGTQCGSPALRGRRFCFFHKNWQGQRIQLNAKLPDNSTFTLPVLEDADSVQVALMQVMRLILSGQLEPKMAGLLLYALQTASLNLRHTELEPRPRRKVVIDPSSVADNNLDDDLWQESDFEEEEEETEEDDEDDESDAGSSHEEDDDDEDDPERYQLERAKRQAAERARLENVERLAWNDAFGKPLVQTPGRSLATIRSNIREAARCSPKAAWARNDAYNLPPTPRPPDNTTADPAVKVPAPDPSHPALKELASNPSDAALKAPAPNSFDPALKGLASNPDPALKGLGFSRAETSTNPPPALAAEVHPHARPNSPRKKPAQNVPVDVNALREQVRRIAIKTFERMGVEIPAPPSPVADCEGVNK